MRFGAMVLADHDPQAIVGLATTCEAAGFDYFWINDCDLLFRNPWPLFSLILNATTTIKVGPLVTNPKTRHVSVTAGLLATLDELSPGRVVCGMGRGDASVRIIDEPASTVDEMSHAAQTLRALTGGQEVEFGSSTVNIDWHRFDLELWGAGYGPRTLGAVAQHFDGCVVQGAAVPLVQWLLDLVRESSAAANRTQDLRVLVGAPTRVTDSDPETYKDVAWFASVVGAHLSNVTQLYGSNVPARVRELVDAMSPGKVRARGGIHGEDADVPDTIARSMSMVGTVDRQVERLTQLRGLGVDLFTLYLDARSAYDTVDRYRTHILPHFQTEAHNQTT